MFNIYKYPLYLIASLLFFLTFFSCEDGMSASSIPMELIPEGYRAERYQAENPVMANVAQARVTQVGLDYLKTNLSKVIASVAPEMYVGEDDPAYVDDGNVRIKVCVPSQYGTQLLDYGVGSSCDQLACDDCYDDPNQGVCENQMRCSDGSYGQELTITLLKESIVLRPEDDGTDNDKIHASVKLQLSDIQIWLDTWEITGNQHTICRIGTNVDGNNRQVPIDLDIDFIVNSLNPGETSFNIAPSFNISEDDLPHYCDTGIINFGLDLLKGLIINMVTPIVTDMTGKMTETLLCAKTTPIDEDDLSLGFRCPMNAPFTSYAGVGCQTTEDCTKGFTCIDNFCKNNIECHLYDPNDLNTVAHQCETGHCNKDTGECIEAPLCMENDNQCFEQRLGVDGRIDVMGLIGSFIESDDTSWINFYLNLGHYAKSQYDGFTIGVLAGTSSDQHPCVTPSGKTFDKIIPELSRFQNNFLGTSAYHAGFGLSEYFLNNLLNTAYNSGAMCLNVDTRTVSMISTGTFGLLMPSLNDLTENKDAALMLSVRPQEVPQIKFGPNNTDTNGDLVVGEALINIIANNLSVDIYAFINQQYVRIFTATLDINFGLGLDIDGDGNLMPVLGPIRFSKPDLPGSLSNMRITNAEILREKETDIANILPSVIELGTSMMPTEFPVIALPNMMGFGIEMKKIARVQEGDDPDTQNFLAVFLNILIGVDLEVETENIIITNLVETSAKQPSIKALRKGASVHYTFDLQSNSNTAIEYQYRINKGFWSTFKKGNQVLIDNPILKLQGKYNLDIRARKVGQPRTLSKIIKKTIIVDSYSPRIQILETKDALVIKGEDNVSQHINYEVIINDSIVKQYKTDSEIKLPKTGKHMQVKVIAKDQSGNEHMITKKYNFAHKQSVQITQTEATPEKQVGCNYETTSSNPYLLLFLMFSLVLYKIRKKLLLVVASFLLFFTSCGDGAQGPGCTTDSQCSNGKICVNNVCVTGTRCEEDSSKYECSDCYIEGRCTEATGNNPCQDGCECNTTFGQCFPKEGFCIKNEDCEENYECENKTCVPKKCEQDSDCAFLADQCTGDHSEPICNQAKSCSCFIPCDGGCQDGEFCCLAKTHEQYNSCSPTPIACGDVVCEPGYEVKVIQEGTLDDEVSCERVGVECECVEKPHLKLGTIGEHSQMKLWNDGSKDRILLTGYSSTYQDLVLGLYDEASDSIQWTFIDGLLNDGETTAEITHGPNGPRHGVSQKGIKVGQYASLYVDNANIIHIAYYDQEHQSLRYARVEKISDDNSQIKWDVSIETVDAGSPDRDAGYYTAITVVNNVPMISYMVKSYKDGDTFKSGLHLAQKTNDTWESLVLDESAKDLPCNSGCSNTEACVFDAEKTQACSEDLISDQFSSTSNDLAIPDNNTMGVESQINIQENIKAKEFRISYKITHPTAGHISAILISPEGRSYQLVNHITDPNKVNAPTPHGIEVIKFKLNQISNSNIGGIWTLRVMDMHSGTTGTLNHWSIDVKSLRNQSPYCGTACQEKATGCTPECSAMTNQICIEGTPVSCKKEAKELAAVYHLTGVGLFTKSVALSTGKLAILYYDGLRNNLKLSVYTPETKTLESNQVIDSGKSGRYANLSKGENDALYITYKDRAGNLRFLEYNLNSELDSSMIIDDGVRVNNEASSVHRVGASSLVVPKGEVFEIYYFDQTARKILYKSYNKTSNEMDHNPTVFKAEKEAESYIGSYGFYLNHVKMGDQNYFSSFYYNTQVGQKTDENYSKDAKPNSMGNVKIIK